MEFIPTGLRALEVQGSQFYLRDGLLEVWFAVMADALAADEQPAQWKWRLEDDLRYQATLVFDGLLSACLDGHLAPQSHLDAFVGLCRHVRHELSTGDFAAGPLATRVGSGRWNDGFALRLARVTDAFLWLVSLAQEDGSSVAMVSR